MTVRTSERSSSDKQQEDTIETAKDDKTAPTKLYFIGANFTADFGVFQDYVTKLDGGKGVLTPGTYLTSITDAQAKETRKQPWCRVVRRRQFFFGEEGEVDEDH